MTRGGVRFLCALGVLVAVGSVAGAAEIHSLYEDGCRRTSGVLVHVSTTDVVLVGLDGQLASRPRAGIEAIVVHKTLESPLAELDVTPELAGYLRDVWVGDDTQPTFTGWATAFFDDLVLYLDLEGRTHVLEAEELRRIRRYQGAPRRILPPTHAAVALAFPTELVPCGGAVADPGAVLPSRVIADRIKVGDYLLRLEERYRAQDDFEERTQVYARPFLFDPQSRLGLLYDPDTPIDFPLYMRWSSGRPYRFQSQNVVGNAAHEWLPIATPTISARSDVKSHFFSATFIGQLVALSAGSNPYWYLDPPKLDRGDTARLERSYNYALFMGGDWWRLSVGAGVSYLAARVTVPGLETRTIVAGSMSPTARVRYLGPDLELRAVYFRTRTEGSLADALGDLGDQLPPGLEYGWRADTARVGATWQPHATVVLVLDQLITHAEYEDAVPTMPIALDAWEATTRGELAVTFGRYVTVRAHVRLDVRKIDVSVPTSSATTTTGTRLGGALEFVF